VQAAETVPEVVVVYSSPDGIVPGGSVKLWCPNGATNPQLEQAKDPGYVQVDAPVPFKTGTDVINFWKQYKVLGNPSLRRFVTVALPEGLPPGGELVFRWKNVTVDERAGCFDGDRWVFQIAVDHDADGFAELIPDPPAVPKHPGPAVRLLARISSTAVAGEPVRLNICAFDRFDNPASGFAGSLTVLAAPGVLPPGKIEISGHGATQCEVRLATPGFHWIKVRSANGLETESNPVEVFESDPGERLCWGDIHVHTEMSADARAAAHTVSSYAGSYRIGRYQYALDFQANTDHQGVLQGNYDADDWEQMRKITNEANEPGTFVTLVAAELSGPKGDQNVYFPGSDAPFLDHDPGDLGGREKAWEKLKGTECFLVPHHFCQSMRPWDWSVFNPSLQPVAEIFSNHGRAEYPGNDPAYCGHGKATLEGHTWVEQLNTGKMLGAIASSDDHWARPGTCGLTGVWVPSLTRDAVYRAIKTRRCYATTSARVILHLQIDGQETGQALACAKPPVFNIRAAAPGPIRKLEIIRDGETVYSLNPGGREVDAEWQEQEVRAAWYYVRLTLFPDPNAEASMKNKEQFVWSSPVWISPAG
jgi:hypothetical protein